MLTDKEREVRHTVNKTYLNEVDPAELAGHLKAGGALVLPSGKAHPTAGPDGTLYRAYALDSGFPNAFELVMLRSGEVIQVFRGNDLERLLAERGDLKDWELVIS
jgi:hypothetical protein